MLTDVAQGRHTVIHRPLVVFSDPAVDPVRIPESHWIGDAFFGGLKVGCAAHCGQRLRLIELRHPAEAVCKRIRHFRGWKRATNFLLCKQI